MRGLLGRVVRCLCNGGAGHVFLAQARARAQLHDQFGARRQVRILGTAVGQLAGNRTCILGVVADLPERVLQLGHEGGVPGALDRGGAGLDDGGGCLAQVAPAIGILAATQQRERQHVGPGLLQQDQVEPRQRAPGDQALDLVGGSLPCEAQLLAPACGLDLAALAHLVLACRGLQAALQCMVGGDEGVVSGFRVFMHGTDRALQQAKPLWVEVILAQPARTGQRHRIQQHPRRMRGIGEEAVVAQGQLQQRELEAIDQGMAGAAGSQFALQLGQEQAEQLEAVAVGIGEGDAMAVHLPRLRQQGLADVGQVAVLAAVAPQAAQRCENFVAGQRLAHAFLGAARAQLRQQLAAACKQPLQGGKGAFARRIGRAWRARTIDRRDRRRRRRCIGRRR